MKSFPSQWSTLFRSPIEDWYARRNFMYLIICMSLTTEKLTQWIKVEIRHHLQDIPAYATMNRCGIGWFDHCGHDVSQGRRSHPTRVTVWIQHALRTKGPQILVGNIRLSDDCGREKFAVWGTLASIRPRRSRSSWPKGPCKRSNLYSSSIQARYRMNELGQLSMPDRALL